MDNSLLLEQLKKIDGLQLNPHRKNDLVNGECTSRNSSSRRKNVIGDIIQMVGALVYIKMEDGNQENV